MPLSQRSTHFFQENALGSKGFSLESERGPAVFLIMVGVLYFVFSAMLREDVA